MIRKGTALGARRETAIWSKKLGHNNAVLNIKKLTIQRMGIKDVIGRLEEKQ